MPIRIHLTLWYTFLLGVILLTFSSLLFLVLKFSLHSQIDSNLQDRAQQVLTGIEAQAVINLETGEVYVPQANIFSSPATFIQVIRADGSIVSATDNLGATHLPSDPQIIAANLNAQDTFKTVTVDNTPLRIYSTPHSAAQSGCWSGTSWSILK